MGGVPRSFKSIVIFGKIHFIETPEMGENRLKREAHIVQVLTLNMQHMTGKRVVEG